MLQLPGGVGLRVDVGDLLQLQGALHADGVVHVAADEEDGGVVEVEGGEVLDVRPVGQDLLHLVRNGLQLRQDGAVFLPGQGAQLFRAVQADEVHHRQLGGEGLGGGHGDLRPGPGVEHVVALPGDGGAHHVDDGQHPGPQPPGLPHGGQGVHRLAGLGDHQGQGLVGDDGVAVAELGGQGHLHRLAQQPLQGVLGHHAHVVGGAAGDDIQLVHLPQVVRLQAQAVQRHLPLQDAGGDGLAEGLGLLHDLLGHEVLVPALLGGGDLPVHVVVLLLHRAEVGVVHPQVVGGELGDLPVVQVAHVPGVLDQGGYIGGQEVGSVSKAQDQGAVLPGGDEPVGTVGAEDAQGVGPLNQTQHLPHRRQNVPVVVVLQKLGHHLGVGLGNEGDPLRLQKLPQLHIVFDDAVVHHGKAAALADLGVGVHVRGLPVGGPAGVAQADDAMDSSAPLHQLIQHLKPALGLGHLQALLLPVNRDARGVIAPIFQPGQAVQQNGGGLLPANKSDNTAHWDVPPGLIL